MKDMFSGDKLRNIIILRCLDLPMPYCLINIHKKYLDKSDLLSSTRI